MWARYCEIGLGIWLGVSHFVFFTETYHDLITACLIVLFAALSFAKNLNKMHLLQILPIGWLLYTSYTYPTPFLPFGLQNHILVALTLSMFAIIPSNASEHPRPWKRFLKDLDDEHHSKE